MVRLSDDQQRELDDLKAIDDAQALRLSDARLGRLQELMSLAAQPEPEQPGEHRAG